MFTEVSFQCFRLQGFPSQLVCNHVIIHSVGVSISLRLSVIVLVSRPVDTNVMAIVFTSRVSRFRLTTKLVTEGAKEKRQRQITLYMFNHSNQDTDKRRNCPD